MKRHGLLLASLVLTVAAVALLGIGTARADVAPDPNCHRMS